MATKIARAMVTEYGMSAKLGAVRYGQEGGGDPFLGRSMGVQSDYSHEIAREIDEEVRNLIEAAHTEAWAILNEYRDALDLIATELLERETLTRKDLEKILAGVEKRPRITAFNDFGGRTPSDRPPVKTPRELAIERGETWPEPAAAPVLVKAGAPNSGAPNGGLPQQRWSPPTTATRDLRTATHSLRTRSRVLRSRLRNREHPTTERPPDGRHRVGLRVRTRRRRTPPDSSRVGTPVDRIRPPRRTSRRASTVSPPNTVSPPARSGAVRSTAPGGSRRTRSSRIPAAVTPAQPDYPVQYPDSGPFADPNRGGNPTGENQWQSPAPEQPQTPPPHHSAEDEGPSTVRWDGPDGSR